MKITMKSMFQIFMFCLLGIVLMTAFFSFRKDLNGYLQENAYLSLSEIAVEHKNYFHCRLEGEWNVLKSLASSIQENEPRDDQRIFAMMDRLVEITGFQCFSIVDQDGTRVSNKGHRDNISDYEIFPEMMRGELAVSKPMDSLVDGHESEVIFLSCPVFENGQVKYSVMGAYPAKELSAVLLSASFGGQCYSTIIDTEGDVVVTDNHSNRLSQLPNIYDFYESVSFDKQFSLAKLENDIRNDRQGTFSYEYDGNYRMGYYQPAGIEGWAILSVMPRMVVSDSATTIANIVNRLIITVTCVFIILILWVFAKTKAESRLFKAKAEKDSMTGLLNKVTTEKQVESVLQQVSDSSHALFVLDIDDFKGINDTLGHAAGDKVIIRVASILGEVFRSDDIMGRIGGDEFAVLFKNVRDKGDLCKKAGELISSFKGMEVRGEKSISCSIGIAISDGKLSTFTKLYKAADHALYQAKGQGKSQYMIYHENEPQKREDAK